MLLRSTLALTFAAALGLASSPALAKDATHVVHKGQSLGAIARRYHAPIEVVREVNGLKPGQALQPGQRLLIPDKSKHEYWLKRAQARTETDKSAKEKAKREADKAPKGKNADDDADDKPAKGAKADKAKDAKDAKDSKDSKASKDSGAGPKGDYSAKPKKPGFVKMVRGSESFSGQVTRKNGKLAPGAIAGFAKVMKSNGGAKLDPDPRLVALVMMVSDHFGGRTIRVTSGYRPYTPSQYTPHSNHNHGRALDFAVEGVPNTVVRDYCRTFRNAGVGYYPNSSFVHLDVRETKVYWVDYSGPGEKPNYSHAAKPQADAPPAEEAHAHDDTGATGATTPSENSEKPAPTVDTPAARQ